MRFREVVADEARATREDIGGCHKEDASSEAASALSAGYNTSPALGERDRCVARAARGGPHAWQHAWLRDRRCAKAAVPRVQRGILPVPAWRAVPTSLFDGEPCALVSSLGPALGCGGGDTFPHSPVRESGGEGWREPFRRAALHFGALRCPAAGPWRRHLISKSDLPHARHAPCSTAALAAARRRFWRRFACEFVRRIPAGCRFCS